MDSVTNYKFSRYDLRFLIKLKTRDFKKQNIQNISEEDVKDYLFNVRWRDKDAIPMCDIVDDIMNLQFSDIFEYLSVKVVKEASHLSINDFNEFISK